MLVLFGCVMLFFVRLIISIGCSLFKFNCLARFFCFALISIPTSSLESLTFLCPRSRCMANVTHHWDLFCFVSLFISNDSIQKKIKHFSCFVPFFFSNSFFFWYFVFWFFNKVTNFDIWKIVHFAKKKIGKFNVDQIIFDVIYVVVNLRKCWDSVLARKLRVELCISVNSTGIINISFSVWNTRKWTI